MDNLFSRWESLYVFSFCSQTCPGTIRQVRCWAGGEELWDWTLRVCGLLGGHRSPSQVLPVDGEVRLP